MAGDVVSLLEVADDPLLLGLRLGERAAAGDDQLGLLFAVLERYRDRCSPDALRAMGRCVQRLLRRMQMEPAELLAAVPANGDAPAMRWFRAMVCEAAGAPAEALAILETLPDADPGEGRAFRLLAAARALIACERPDAAAYALRDAIRSASSYRTLQAADALVEPVASLPVAHVRGDANVAILGDATYDLFAPALRATAFAAGIQAHVYVGGIGQYQHEILDAHSFLTAFEPDAVIIAPHWRSLGLADEDDDPDATVDAAVSGLVTLWRQCRERLHALVIQHTFEVPAVDAYGRLSRSLPGGRARVIERINGALRDAERGEPGVAIVDVDEAASQYGKTAWNDAALWHTAKQYPAADAMPSLARRDAAVLQAAWGLSAKCVALDLDGTLWGGVLGEDGLGGIELGGTGTGEAYADFQRYLQGLQRRGIALAVCSKNNPDDALQAFREHPEMVLATEDVALFEVNWQPKDESLRRIAATLNVGLDSIVFVDDSPQERALVRQRLPQVTVPELPADPALFAQELASGMFFESLTITEEDRQRTRSYHENVERTSLEAASASLDEFLHSLRMAVELRPFEEIDLPRIVQLINKTNQFNLTTRRRSEAEVRDLMGRADVYTQAVRVKDRFGDNGLTGVLIACQEDGRITIDTWLLSCRVMGRRVEDVMLHSLLRHATRRGADVVLGAYRPTSKNAPVRDLFDRLGFERLEECPNGERRYEWRVGQRAAPSPPFFHIDDRT